MTIYIGICEDEAPFRTDLKVKLGRLLEREEIKYRFCEFKSGEELLANYPKELDLLLLDIQMKKLSGMDVARKVRTFNKSIPIIFISSFLEFALEGYEVWAYRFLTKPIKERDLVRHILPCVQRCLQKKENYLTINRKDFQRRLAIDSIIYIETNRQKLLIHMLEETCEVRMSLSALEKMLSENHFFRCHTSYLVNLKHVKKLEPQSIVMTTKKEIPVSKYRRVEFKKALTNALGELL